MQDVDTKKVLSDIILYTTPTCLYNFKYEFEFKFPKI